MSQTTLEGFKACNDAMANAVAQAVAAGFGTPRERENLRAITQSAIDTGTPFRELLVKGITLDTWVAHLRHSLGDKAVLNLIGENTKPIEDFRAFIDANDLQPVFDHFIEIGAFKVENHDLNIKILSGRLEHYEKIWLDEDAKKA